MKADNSGIAMIRGEDWDVVTINNEQYYQWRGYAMYDWKPFCQISGLEAVNPKGFDGKPPQRSIMISEYISKEEREEGREGAKICILKVKDFIRDDGTTGESLSAVECKLFEMNFPVKGWINAREVGTEKGKKQNYLTAKIRFNPDDLLYFQDESEPDGGGFFCYLKNGKPIPNFITEAGADDDEAIPIIEALQEDYPNFQDWYKTFFPSSGSFFVKNANKRADIMARLFKGKKTSSNEAKPNGNYKMEEVPY